MPVSAQTLLAVEDLPFVDVTAPGFAWEDPRVVAAREECWAARTPTGLLTLRYAEAAELGHHPRLISNFLTVAELGGVTGGPVYDFMRDFLHSRNGEDHRRVRRLATQVFTACKITELRPFVHATAQRLAEQLADRSPCDFMDVFADPLPVEAICRLLGVPSEDHDTIRHWNNDAGLVLALASDRGLLGRVEQGLAGLFGEAEKLISEPTASPGDGGGLLSGLLRAHREQVLDRDELRNLLVLLLIAGHHNISHQLGQALVAFAGHPDQWALLRQRPELADRAVEEVLRWCPVLPAVQLRVAAEDLDYQGLRIPAGTTVQGCAYAAHRDPRVFADGDAFDITAEREAPPLTFGGGPHHCLGAALTRIELAEALTVLTARLGPPLIAGPITWRPPIGTTGPQTLPLSFDRGLPRTGPGAEWEGQGR